MKKRIFIGSSTEGLEKAHQIADVLSSLTDVEPVLWTSVFEPGMLTFEALETMLLECCAAVFVASPDDQCLLRGTTIKTPRSNVLLEFGLVAGRLGRHSIAVCLFGGATLPSDLQGLTVIPMDHAGSETKASELAGQDKLRAWTASLLGTVAMIARTDVVHGYTGRWAFELRLDQWRSLTIDKPSFAYVKGTFDLLIPANGQAGKGLAHGRLFFKLINPAAQASTVYQGELRTAHEIATASCEKDGSLCFTSQAFAVEKMNEIGSAPSPLSGLDIVEPWSAQWQLTPGFEPRTLCGTVSTDSTIGTHGTAKANKL